MDGRPGCNQRIWISVTGPVLSGRRIWILEDPYNVSRPLLLFRNLNSGSHLPLVLFKDNRKRDAFCAQPHSVKGKG